LIANQAESEWNEHVRIEERRFMPVEKSVCDVPQLPQEMKIILWSAQNLGTEKQNNWISHCYRQNGIQQQDQ
jgi:hypothetical protein